MEKQKKITRDCFVDIMAERNMITKVAAREFVDMFISTLTTALADGGRGHRLKTP